MLPDCADQSVDSNCSGKGRLEKIVWQSDSSEMESVSS
ncbi:hypothetical protein RISK_006250 [Rhodopirellula islandica]|uniref:Uncharacterized protein n=1 Tax=Rhodopirellula islandica TaxID=595434 RepID=A0A0J1B5H3_RHOIS|nr:hypothetical protein RISK_006250 [Rhodopirellula islandica]